MATPADLTGKVLWLRAKDLPGSAGSAVTTWPDQSGGHNDAKAAGTTPTLATSSTPNGGKSVAFGGSGYFTLLDTIFAGGADARGWAPSEDPFRAFDGNTGTQWTDTGAGSGSWLSVRAKAQAVLTAYSIRVRSGWNDRSPKSWIMQGSNDNQTWVDLDSRSGQAFADGGTNNYTVSGAAAYQFYRLWITQVNASSIVNVTELTLTGPSLVQTAAEAWFVVKSGEASGNFRGLSSLGNSEVTSPSMYPSTDGTIQETAFIRTFAGTDRRIFTPSVPITQWRLYRVSNDGSAYEIRLDEQLQSSTPGLAFDHTHYPRLGANLNASQGFFGNVAEVLIRDRVATSAEVADLITYVNTEHGLTVPGGSAAGPQNYPATGTADAASDATAAAVLQASASGSADAVSGATAAAVLQALASGSADAVSDAEARATVTLPSGIDYPVTGEAAATSDADARATYTAAVSGTADAVSDAEARASMPLAPDEVEATSITRTTSALTDPADLEEVEAESRTRFTSSAMPSLDVTINPQTQRPDYSLKVVDRTGQPLGELENAALGNITRTRNGRGSFSFTLPKDDPKLSLIRQFSEVQVWIGREMVRGGWFIIVNPEIDDGTVWRYQCAGIRWHLETRRIGKELPNLLRNGDFESGTRFWHPRWFEGSAAEAPPKVTIVKGAAALEGGQAIEVTGVEKVTKKSVQSDAIFIANRPYAGEPLENGFLPDGQKIIKDNIKNIAKGSAVTVEGHTADADAGTGYELSVRRAEAAKAVILKARPDLKVTAVGKGETEQVAPNDTEANQAKNRRLVIIANITSIGHRQAETQRLFYTPQANVRRPGELRLNGWVNLIDYVGPSKDGWLLYLGARKINAKKDEPGDSATSSIDEGFPVERWTPDGVTLGGLKPGQTYAVEVRLYPTAGKTRFDRFTLKPNLITAWYNKTRPEIIKGLVEHAQDPEYHKADVNIGTNCKPFGTRTDQEYEWENRRTVDDCIADLLRGDGAPDFEVVVTQNRRVATTWANRGRRTHVPLKLGDIVTDYTSGIDGDIVASTAIVQASRSRGSKSEAFARTTRSDGLVLERIFDAEQDSTDSVCMAQARAALRYGRTDVITSVTCDSERTVWLLERVDLADICRVEIPDAGLDGDGDYRIEEITLDPNSNRLTYRLAVEA